MKKVTTVEIIEIMKNVGVNEKIIKNLKNDVPLLSQGLDSIDMPAIAAAAETKFKIDMSDILADKMKTVDEFVAFINSKLK